MCTCNYISYAPIFTFQHPLQSHSLSPQNPLKMFQFCPCYVPMETPRKSLNFSHAALVGHQLSRAKRDPPSQQAGSQKNHPILKTRICKYFNFDQKHISTSNYLGLVQAAPLPTLVGRVACCQLALHAGCGPPQGHPQGPAPLAGLLRAL